MLDGRSTRERLMMWYGSGAKKMMEGEELLSHSRAAALKCGNNCRMPVNDGSECQ